MINTQKLKGRIIEKGLTYQILAPRVGCTAYTLGKKVANETPMNLEEAWLLSQILQIKQEEFADFFLQKSCIIQQHKK